MLNKFNLNTVFKVLYISSIHLGKSIYIKAKNEMFLFKDLYLTWSNIILFKNN